MFTIGLIREGKIPADNRVALTPAQCKWLCNNFSGTRVIVQPCVNRGFKDHEYTRAGIEINENLQQCDLLLGIKEVPIGHLLPGKKYLFFSHTKKKQPHNQKLLKAILDKKITLIDYECLEHEDGQRIIGFGFFAGIVGAHNGMMAYGQRTRLYQLCRVGQCADYKQLINTYFGLKLPNIKIAVTGSGRVASGVLEIMNLLDVIEVEPEDYLQRNFNYPVYVHLKGNDLYYHKTKGNYSRGDFHNNPADYRSKFVPYLSQADILLNGIYWEKNIPRLFSWFDMLSYDFRIQTIADISDDKEGAVPCNLGDSTIENPVYGVDAVSRQIIDPYQKGGIDIMAISNLPNELPRDASSYFGDQLLKYIIPDLLNAGSPVIDRATMVYEGRLTERYKYLEEYAAGEV